MGQRAKGAGAEDRLMLCATGLERARSEREQEGMREGRGCVGGSGGSELRSFSGEGFFWGYWVWVGGEADSGQGWIGCRGWGCRWCLSLQSV